MKEKWQTYETYFDYNVNQKAPRLNLKILQFKKLPFIHPARFDFMS